MLLIHLNVSFVLQKETTARVIRDITQAFKAAVATTKGDKEIDCRYTVEDSSGKWPAVMKCSMRYVLSKNGLNEMNVIFLLF